MNIRLSIRNLVKNRQENLVSLAGLSLGMMVAILSITYIIFESSYDSFHSLSNRIFAVYTRIAMPGSDAILYATEKGMKSYAVNNVPAVEMACTVKEITTDLVMDNTAFKGTDGYYTGPEFFSIFGFKLLSGNPGLLSEPGNIFLTERLSEKMSGGTDCSGRTISIDGKLYIVAGIIEDPPANSDLDFDFLLPETETETSATSHKDADKVNLYVLTNTSKVKSTFLQDNLDQYFVLSGKERERSEVIALKDLHQYKSKTEKSFYIFISVSLLVLFTSMVNFVNTQLARMQTRTRETGIRKAAGASRGTIIRMVTAETLLFIFIASISGLILSKLFLSCFQNLTFVTVQMYGPGLWKIQIVVFALALLLGVMAGLIISIRYSGYNTITLIRGLFTVKNNNYGRKTFIGMQFAISGGLIILMIIIYMQLHYLEKKDMGFDPHNRLLIELSPVLAKKYDMIRNEILGITGVEMVTGRGGVFGKADMAMPLIKGENTPENRFFVFGYNVEDNFFETYGINLIEGKMFSDVSRRDSSLIITDKFTAGMLGLQHPVGEKVKVPWMTAEIIGLVEDADFIALSSQRMPRVYLRSADHCAEVTVKYNGDEEAVTAAIDRLLTQLDPDYSPVYMNLEDAIAGLYKKETNLFNIITICGLIAIVLSLTGAYAMATYLAERRTRADCIRRAFGASERDIIFKALCEAGWPVLAGNTVIWPVVYIVAGNWLSHFSEKITIGIFPFLISLTMVSLLVAGTVYAISRRSVMINPAEILRQD